MHSDIDFIFEQATCDTWWLQGNGNAVRRPEIEYLKSPYNRRLYNAVIRVDPSYRNVENLVSEVMEAHQGKGSEWRIGSPSYTPKLERSVFRAGYKEEGRAWSIDVSESRPKIPFGIDIQRVENIQQMRDMDQVKCASFSKTSPKEKALLEKELQLYTGNDPRCMCFVAYDSKTKQPISTGGVNIYAQF